MAITKFKVEVIRTDEFIVEIDEEIYNEEWRKNFEKVFWPLESTEDIAKDLAIHQAERGDKFQEGYGYIKRDGKLWFPIHDKKAQEGLHIRTIDVDNTETEVVEVQQEYKG
jgi:hypothetical protein